MANHLVIGLGGTGGRIIRSFRKKIYENFRQEDPPGVNIRFLYVDSSDELMRQDDPEWKVLGRSVQLKQDSQLKLQGMNLEAVLAALDHYPGIQPWLGDREQFRSMLGTIDAANLYGGQKRRLGRFLFACKAGEFRTKVINLVNQMQVGQEVDTTFHVCCGLAGGTGSGCVVDVVSQLRKFYPQVGCKIIIYAFLPEEYPDPNKATENYHANGYAALLELNALGAGTWRPHDVSGVNGGARLENIQSPFNCCYLFTDVNEAGQRVDLERELWDIVASFLYLKIVAARNFNWESLRRQENFENLGEAIEAERSSANGPPERCRLFFSFGIKQIAYPEKEILEYLTYSFARQASLQLRFNNWSDSVGFLDQPANRSYAERVTLEHTRQRWRMTDDHLSLSLGILPDEINNRQWRPIGESWENLITNLKAHVRENIGNRREWNDALKRLCATAYNENYRSLGVQRFYETKLRDLPDQVREIRRLLETDLFEEWRNGSMSLDDISRFLAVLVEDLERRNQELEDKIRRTRENVEQLEGLLAANDREWAKVGLLSEWLGKYDKLFDAQGNHLRGLYALRTRLAGMEYAKRLIPALVSEVQSLSREVSECSTLVTECASELETRMRRRCADPGDEDFSRVVVRFYSPATVREFEKRLRIDQALQKSQTAAVRNSLTKLLDKDQSFGHFKRRLTNGVLLEELERLCEESAMQGHDGLVAQNRLAPILRVNIIERLFHKYGNNPEQLRNYAREIVRNAQTFLPLDDAEVYRRSPGIPYTATPHVTYFTVVMPDTQGYDEFARQLGEELISATGQAQGQNVVQSADKKDEITLVCVRNVMPARYASSVAMLRQRYEMRMNQVRGTPPAMMLHIEGDGSQFPSLFVRTVKAEDVHPYVLIAQAMGLIQQLEDPNTGLTNIYLVTNNDHGLPNPPVLLGETLDEVLQNANQGLLDQLRTAIDRLLATTYLHRRRREELMGRIGRDAQLLLQRVGNNPLDSEYTSYVRAAERASRILAVGQ